MVCWAITSPREFYRTVLKKYAFFRFLRGLLQINFSLLIGRFVFRIRAKDFRLISMKDFLTSSNGKSISISTAETIEIGTPQFLGDYTPALREERSTLLLKELPIEINRVSSVVAIGGTNLLVCGNKAIYPDIFDPGRDYIPAEKFGVGKIFPESEKLSFYFSRRKHRVVPPSISLLGQCTGNYAHFLTETLPKLVIVDEYEEFKDFPILIDSWIHPNIKDTISVFGRYERELIPVDRWEGVYSDLIIDVSPTAYITPEYRCFVETKQPEVITHEAFPFSKFALDKLRSRSLEVAHQYDVNPLRKNLYLQRNPETTGNMRTIVNIKEIEACLREFDFTTADPGKLSVPEQVALFRNASFIVAPVGAALVNAIFTKPGCVIVALAPYYENANYYYFSNLMEVLGHHIYYVTGPQVISAKSYSEHENFSIHIDDFRKAMKTLAEKL